VVKSEREEGKREVYKIPKGESTGNSFLDLAKTRRVSVREDGSESFFGF